MRRPPNLMKDAPTSPAPAPVQAEPSAPANYLDLYGLSKPPFDGVPDSAGYILFPSHRRAFERLADHLMNGRGVVLLQGEEGIGKTETLRAVAAVAKESGVQTIQLSRPPNGRLTLPRLTSALAGRPASVDDAVTAFLAEPRKALLVDDADLLPADCIEALVSLVGRLPLETAGPAILLATAQELTPESRPDLAPIISAARDTIRLLRLGPAEVRQYIERSLWVAGGTTRRLIAPDAMKVLIARSGGAPGQINRLMEAAFTAGFARGDTMIAAKTIAAAVGPTTARPRSQPPRAPGMTAQAMQIISVGLLVTGAAVFLYRGLTEPEPPAPVAAPPPQAVIVKPPEPPPPDVKPPERMPPALVAALMKRGSESLGLGDIAAARLLFQRAAEGGNAQAATALGKTYDPKFVSAGSPPDAAQALEWYRKAVGLGDPQAADLLKRLGGT